MLRLFQQLSQSIPLTSKYSFYCSIFKFAELIRGFRWLQILAILVHFCFASRRDDTLQMILELCLRVESRSTVTWPSWNDRIWLGRWAVRNRSNRRIFRQVRSKGEIGRVSGLWYDFCLRLVFSGESLDHYAFRIYGYLSSKLVLVLACVLTWWRDAAVCSTYAAETISLEWCSKLG